MNHRASVLSMNSKGIHVQMKFVSPAYELTLRNDTSKVNQRVLFTAEQLRKVALDMRPVDQGGVRLTYAARHILIEIHEKLFARVLDVDFMRLYNAAGVGAGETITSDNSLAI